MQSVKVTVQVMRAGGDNVVGKGDSLRHESRRG